MIPVLSGSRRFPRMPTRPAFATTLDGSKYEHQWSFRPRPVPAVPAPSTIQTGDTIQDFPRRTLAPRAIQIEFARREETMFEFPRPPATVALPHSTRSLAAPRATSLPPESQLVRMKSRRVRLEHGETTETTLRTTASDGNLRRKRWSQRRGK